MSLSECVHTHLDSGDLVEQNFSRWGDQFLVAVMRKNLKSVTIEPIMLTEWVAEEEGLQNNVNPMILPTSFNK